MTVPSLGRDLLLTPFFRADEWDVLDLERRPAGTPWRDEPVDLAVADDVEALRQALVIRLLTPKGTLTELGHAGYGSRLHELIGEQDGEVTRLRARLYVLEAIGQERRVEEVISLDISSSTAAPDRLFVNAQVKPVGRGDPVSLGLEVGL